MSSSILGEQRPSGCTWPRVQTTIQTANRFCHVGPRRAPAAGPSTQHETTAAPASIRRRAAGRNRLPRASNSPRTIRTQMSQLAPGSAADTKLWDHAHPSRPARGCSSDPRAPCRHQGRKGTGTRCTLGSGARPGAGNLCLQLWANCPWLSIAPIRRPNGAPKESGPVFLRATN